LGRPSRHRPPALIAPLAALAAVVMAATLLPAWDHYVLYIHALGQSRSVDAGSAFAASTPTGGLVGDLIAAVAWAVVPVAGVLWRPGRIGALLSAGVLVAVASQVASAVAGFDAPGTLQLLVSPADIQRYGVVLQSASLTGWYDVEVLSGLALAMLLLVRWWTPEPVADVADAWPSPASWPPPWPSTGSTVDTPAPFAPEGPSPWAPPGQSGPPPWAPPGRSGPPPWAPPGQSGPPPWAPPGQSGPPPWAPPGQSGPPPS
ncbi:MAG: hypothetical protein ACYDEN_03985, partial [Acidimicrobiales bacterium]